MKLLKLMDGQLINIDEIMHIYKGVDTFSYDERVRSRAASIEKRYGTPLDQAMVLAAEDIPNPNIPILVIVLRGGHAVTTPDERDWMMIQSVIEDDIMEYQPDKEDSIPVAPWLLPPELRPSSGFRIEDAKVVDGYKPCFEQHELWQNNEEHYHLDKI